MNTNTQNKPKQHPHAELIKAWADGANIQYKNENNEWITVNHPSWYKNNEYRIKPEEPSNEPWKPKKGMSYLIVNSCGSVDYKLWGSSTLDEKHYKIGNCFHLQSDAEAAAERVKAALKGELVDKEEHERVCTQNKALRAGLKEAQKGLEIIATNGLHELKKTAPSDENFQLDGKPLTGGEKSLVRALRDAKIQLIPDFATSVLCYPSDNGKSVYPHGSPIALLTPSYVDEKIIAALKQIKAEQEASND